MPRPKEPDDRRGERERRERDEHAHRGHEPRERDREWDEGRPRPDAGGREHAVFQQIIDRRLSGGAPATSEAYARALEQWHQLPGSIVRPPTDEKPALKAREDGGEAPTP